MPIKLVKWIILSSVLFLKIILVREIDGQILKEYLFFGSQQIKNVLSLIL